MRRRFVEMRWRDALFAHWGVDPAVVDTALPDALDAAAHDGEAYLGIVAFAMEDIRPRGFPAGLTFGEVNLRTYVDGPDGGQGIYFFNLDAADPLGVAVARRTFRLPYYRAHMRIRRDPVENGAGDASTAAPTDGVSADDSSTAAGDDRREVSFTGHRTHRGAPEAHFDATYRPSGEAFTAASGPLEAFLVENYCFYVRGSRLYRGDVEHDHWTLYEGDLALRSTSLFEANGFEVPSGEPLVHYSPGVDVGADRLRRVE